jgi:hypothetical protein
VYPTVQVQEDGKDAPMPKRQGEGWGVAASTPATADELLKILNDW